MWKPGEPPLGFGHHARKRIMPGKRWCKTHVQCAQFGDKIPSWMVELEIVLWDIELGRDAENLMVVHLGKGFPKHWTSISTSTQEKPCAPSPVVLYFPPEHRRRGPLLATQKKLLYFAWTDSDHGVEMPARNHETSPLVFSNGNSSRLRVGTQKPRVQRRHTLVNPPTSNQRTWKKKNFGRLLGQNHRTGSESVVKGHRTKKILFWPWL